MIPRNGSIILHAPTAAWLADSASLLRILLKTLRKLSRLSRWEQHAGDRDILLYNRPYLESSIVLTSVSFIFPSSGVYMGMEQMGGA